MEGLRFCIEMNQASFDCDVVPQNQKVMKQVTMYKIPHTHVTTEAMTTAHLATGVSMLFYVQCIINICCELNQTEISQSMEPQSKLEKKVALNKSFAVT